MINWGNAAINEMKTDGLTFQGLTLMLKAGGDFNITKSPHGHQSALPENMIPVDLEALCIAFINKVNKDKLGKDEELE